MSGAINRRRFLDIGAGGASLLLGSSLLKAQTPKLEGELVFAGPGGGTQTIVEKQFFTEFSRQNGGVKCTFVPGQPSDVLAKLRAQRNSPSMDVVWLTGGAIYEAMDDGLLGDVDLTLVPNVALLSNSVPREKAAVSFAFITFGPIYNTDIFKQKNFPAPTSWLDFWDPKYKGHVGFYSINVNAAVVAVIEISRLLTGDYRNLDAAFVKFRELKPNVTDFYNAAGPAEVAMQQGNAWIEVSTPARALQLKNSGFAIDFVVPKEGLPGSPVWLGIVKNSKNARTAHAWVNYLLSTEVQQSFPNTIGYTPSNARAAIPAELKAYFPDISTVFVPDWRYIGTQLPKMVDLWNREIER